MTVANRVGTDKHPHSAAVRRIVNAAVLITTPVAKLVRVQLDITALLRPADNALSEC